MGKLNLEILDALHLTQQDRYAKLSILIGMDSFVYMVSDDQQQVVALKHYDFPSSILNPIELGRRLQPLLVEDELLKAPFEQVIVAVDTLHFSIVPETLFKDSQAEQYLQSITTVSDNDKVRVDRISSPKSKLVYKIDKGIHFLLKLHYPSCKIVHLYTPYLANIKNYQNHSPFLRGKQLFVNVQSANIHVTVFDGLQLLMANTYEYHSNEDFLYFIFLIFEQFGLHAEQTPVFLSGSISKTSSLYQRLYERIQHLAFMPWPNGLASSSKLKQQAKHHYFILSGLNLIGN